MRIRIILIVALLLTSTTAWAQNSNFPNLTAEEVRKRIELPEKVLIVDAWTEKECRQAHIPTAINIPPLQFKLIRNHLPQDKVMPIIFYCRGYSWGLTTQAAVAAQSAGHTNIFTFRGGFPEWTSRGYTIVGPWEALEWWTIKRGRH